MIFGQSAGAGSVKTVCESPLSKGLFNKAVIMSGGGITNPNTVAAAPAGRMGRYAPMTLAEAEQATKKIMDWGGYDSLEKMRRASTEMMYTIGNFYAQVTGDRATRMTGSPIVDGYVSLQSFDNAAYANALPNIPYMIGYTQDDMGDMAPGIAEFCLNRESVGDKAYAYEFARPLPTDGRGNVLSGAFHSSDLWYVFKSLQHCWRPWTQGDWDLSEVMLTAWTNFAKYGDPNGPDGGEWKPYTQEDGKFMLFKLDENDAENSETGDPIPSQNRRFPF